ncbi:MAG: hypothetical protein AABX33_01595 [Nanoarchaeota archaeon]
MKINSNKLILLDIFSYSCMNCLRSLYYIKKINNRYKKYGLATVLIHPPEWEFERNIRNILPILQKYKIFFPIIIDKNKKIIKKLKVNFWPSQILINGNKIVYRHIGEGGYKKLEDKIRELLQINIKRLFKIEPSYSKYPAVYTAKSKNGIIKKLNGKLKFGEICLDGKWIQKKEYIKSREKGSVLSLIVKGKIVNFVAQSLNRKQIEVIIKLNNKFIKRLMIKAPQMYRILKLNEGNKNKPSLIVGKGIAIYSFSFQ